MNVMQELKEWKVLLKMPIKTKVHFSPRHMMMNTPVRFGKDVTLYLIFLNTLLMKVYVGWHLITCGWDHHCSAPGSAFDHINKSFYKIYQSVLNWL